MGLLDLVFICCSLFFGICKLEGICFCKFGVWVFFYDVGIGLGVFIGWSFFVVVFNCMFFLLVVFSFVFIMVSDVLMEFIDVCKFLSWEVIVW